MNKVFKVRLYPTNLQITQIDKTIDACRFLYNKTLEERKEVYSKLKDDPITLKSYKYKTEKEYKAEFPFLSEVSSNALQQTRGNLDQAYLSFFKSLKTKRTKGFPKFKSKKVAKKSYRISNGNFHQKTPLIYFENKKINLPKLGLVKFKGLSKHFKGKICNVTIIKEPTNEYFLSILVEFPEIIRLRKSNNVIGLDLGLKEFITCSDGNQIKGIKDELFKIEKEVKTLQKHFARKQKDSKRKEKLRIKIAKKYKCKTNLTNHFHWHLANKLCNENQVIGIENLNVKGMLRNRKLAHSIFYSNWGSFGIKLQQKAEEYGTRVEKVNRFFPSSKTCSKCGVIKEVLTLEERIYACEACNTNIDRDLNASINIRNQCLKNISLEYNDYKHGENVKPKELVYKLDGSFLRSV